MKNLKIVLCIVIIIICIQVTYARFITKQPNGNINANVGQAIIDIEQIGVNSTEYDEKGKPRLIDITDTITYSFSVNNYNANNQISDVDLKYNIYVIFYDNNGSVKTNFDCKLEDEGGNYLSSTTLTDNTILNINGVETVLPVGTIKFTANNVLLASQKNKHKLDLQIKLNIDSLPTSQITPNMQMYCEAEQKI